MKSIVPINPAAKHRIALRGIVGSLLWACLASACGGESPGLGGEPDAGGSPCTVGTPGCACYANGTCDEGLTCGPGDVCQEPDVDTEPECPAGTEDCPCYPNGTCDLGLWCNNFGVCTSDPEGPQPPSDPKCYTPCKADLLLPDDTFVSCPADRLMPGCIGTTICVDGSCVPTMSIDAKGPDDDPCVTDLECPDFQTCIAGKCYSNCDTNGDCAEPLECYRHVCRQPCAVESTDSACPAGTVCEAGDGLNGFCLIKPPENGGEEENEILGTFYLDRSALEFSTVASAVTLVLTNNTPHPVTYTVVKVEHTEHPETGDETVVENPLHWIRVNAVGGMDPQTTCLESLDTACDVRVEANGEVELTFADTLDYDALPGDELWRQRWDGLIAVSNDALGLRRLRLHRDASPKGRWSGTMYYFASFGDQGLDEWRADKDDPGAIQSVGNAFIKRWVALKQGDITVDEFKAVMTATTEESWKWGSVAARCPSSQNPNPNMACYLYDDPEIEGDSGIRVYSSDLSSFPVPTAVSQLPIAMNIRPDSADPTQWSGRIDSTASLHYAGDPEVILTFGRDPTDCPTTGDPCVVPLVDDLTAERRGLSATAVVGGRYLPDADDTGCSEAPAGGFDLLEIPWLVPGFVGPGVKTGPGGPVRRECRDRTLPFTSSTADAAKNLSLALSNPVPDGRSRTRRLTMVDGAMFDQHTMIVLFEERFESFMSDDPDDDFAAYGYLVLGRAPGELEDSDYLGSNQSDPRPQPDVLGVGCSGHLLDRVADALEPLWGAGSPTAAAIRTGDFGNGVALASTAQMLVRGRTDEQLLALEEYDPTEEEIHYLCVDTGLFDKGPDGKTPCPLGSEVIFFMLGQDADFETWDTMENRTPITWQDLTNHACHEGADLQFSVPEDLVIPEGWAKDWWERDEDEKAILTDEMLEVFESPDYTKVLLEEGGTKGTCAQTLEQWRANPAGVAARFDVARTCINGTNYCDVDRFDLTLGKVFYAETEDVVVFDNLDTAIRDAFRYKTKFANRSGTSLAFTPAICGSLQDTADYCYDPGAIGEIRERVDCALSIYTDHHQALAAYDVAHNTELLGDLGAYLQRNFSYSTKSYTDWLSDPDADEPAWGTLTYDGFERLSAELLIMLGDEAYTQAFASRFDLAGVQIATFPGSELEPGGIDLSGGAGFEMYQLYLAAQSYQLALDRLYSLGPTMWLALDQGVGDFITQQTVVTYFSRLIRASGQKARAWSRVAERYQGFGRTDLARSVVERAYVAGYMELVVMSELMLKVVEAVSEEDKAQIIAAVEEAQLRFRQSLLEMRDVYQQLTDDVNVFGFAPDYVPFPLVDPAAVGENALSSQLAWAWQLAYTAADKEELALDSSREFDTDAALFSAELNEININYDNQLKQLCGVFEDDDGQLRVALPENAHLTEATRVISQVLGTPCGWVGTGEIYDAMLELATTQYDFESIALAQNNLVKEVQYEAERISAYCGELVSLNEIKITQEEEIKFLESTISGMELIIGTANRTAEACAGYAQVLTGSATDPLNAVAEQAEQATATSLLWWSFAINELVTIPLEGGIIAQQKKIADAEQAIVTAELQSQCNLAQIDSLAVIKTKYLEMQELELAALKMQYQVQLAFSKIRALRNEVQDLLDDRAASQQLLIDVAAAHNNPNVRIYKNDSIITADRTFERALKAAYEATKVYEYYTGQTYAHADDLLLVRLVQYGDYSLEAYLEGLEDAWLTFANDYGLPDQRVAVYSLRDDILQIPYIDDDSTPLSHEERIQLFRDRLVDAELIDAYGYRTYPFSTNLSSLSPLTRNHKITHIEAELAGENVGDDVGRIYLVQKGTGVVSGVTGGKSYYSFPERTAVVNVFFNGEQPFHEDWLDDIYESWRFKDRPFVNTGWELKINQKDEEVNQDIDLASLSDIRLYIYYSDFTAL